MWCWLVYIPYHIAVCNDEKKPSQIEIALQQQKKEAIYLPKETSHAQFSYLVRGGQL